MWPQKRFNLCSLCLWCNTMNMFHSLTSVTCGVYTSSYRPNFPKRAAGPDSCLGPAPSGYWWLWCRTPANPLLLPRSPVSPAGTDLSPWWRERERAYEPAENTSLSCISYTAVYTREKEHIFCFISFLLNEDVGFQLFSGVIFIIRLIITVVKLKLNP